MATTQSPITDQTAKPTGSYPSTSPDELAGQFATNLDISHNQDEGESKGPSIRAVNEASRALTRVVESGWKKSSNPGTSPTPLTTANRAASKAAKHLSELRRMLPKDLNVERAASSVLGKLVILEMVCYI